MLFNKDDLLAQLNKYTINEGDKNFVYGTAGFRTSAVRLFGIAYRIGIMTVLRSMQEGGAAIGVMVTASHNKAADNGLKVIDKGGEMLDESWEQVAVKLIATPIDEVPEFINSICIDRHIDRSVQGSVFLGEDNRMSSSSISQIVAQGIGILSGKCTYFGKTTTPQLHFLVYKQNCLQTSSSPLSDLSSYFHQICDSFRHLISVESPIINSPLFVDCANGVGSNHLLAIRKYLKPHLNYISICNSDVSGKIINLQCGADHIKAKLQFPIIHNGEILEIRENDRWASIDGDADRLIYFYKKNNSLYLLDGDKQSVLISKYLKDQLESIENWKLSGIKLGVVQTAYANLNCTKTLTENIGVQVVCVPTGVKYLHHTGKELDIRIYFESNGHGSILLSEKARQFLEHNLGLDHPLRFILLNGIINEAVGDSFSILLLIEHILNHGNISLDSWFDIYQDLPSCLLKVKILDRRLIATENCERTVVKPMSLQTSINETLSQLTKGYISRVFVRPSGTEDVVRVYAESEIKDIADNIAIEVARLVYDQVGGVGDRP